jgi:hypothetical protein
VAAFPCGNWGKKYALAYNHRARTIEIRKRNMQGDTLASFTNATPLSEVKRFFAAL